MKKSTKTPKKRLGKQVDGLFSKMPTPEDYARGTRKLFLDAGIQQARSDRLETLASQLLLTMAARADLEPTSLPEVIKACILSSHEFYDQFDESMKTQNEVKP